MRMSIDVGGTFTDLMVDEPGRAATMFKSPTTYPDPIGGILGAIELAAKARKSISPNSLARRRFSSIRRRVPSMPL